MTVGSIVMAAGNASRFGADKLEARFRGKSLLRRALEAVPRDRTGPVAAVVRSPAAERLAEEFGFLPVRNDRPDLGISRTIRLGLDALGPCAAAMFLVADQPLLRRETTAAAVDFYRAHPDRLVGVAHDGARGNPCIFPARFFPELRQLQGDQGGGAVIRRHLDGLLLLEVPAWELADVDTVQALETLEGL